jgi:RNA polymerase sigma factor (sigma-70 family)
VHDPSVHRAIDAVWRIESAKLIAALARITGDVGSAGDLAQDALLAALEQWPESGIPDNPAAWLMSVGKRRAVDQMRHASLADEKHEQIGRELDERPGDDLDAAIDDQIGDDLLRLMFTACHPVLTTEARAALTLRLLGGLTTGEIARAFLASEPAMAQRIVRAKKTLSDAKVPYEVPRDAELAARLGSVLEVIYLIFNEGYSATAGDDWTRPALCEDALRLGRILAELLPGESEVHGLVSLMEIQASRLAARTSPDGKPILLLEQDRSRWDLLLISRGLAALDRARATAVEPGSYMMQAEIAACHGRARTNAETNWPRIVALYGHLARIERSPVVELNRAVAVSMASGAAAGLAAVDALADEPSLKGYHLLFAVRGDLLEKLGRGGEASAEFERAAGLTQNARERELLLARATAAISR